MGYDYRSLGSFEDLQKSKYISFSWKGKFYKDILPSFFFI